MRSTTGTQSQSAAEPQPKRGKDAFHRISRVCCGLQDPRSDQSQRRVLRNSEQEPVVAEQSPKKGECDDFFERLCFGGVAAKLKKPLATLTLARFASVSVTSIRCGMRKMQIWVFANEMTICKNEFRNTLRWDCDLQPKVARALPWVTVRK